MAGTRRYARPDARPASNDAQLARDESHTRAASARRDAYANVKAGERGMVDALLAERRGYEQRGGMADRIRQVTEQLKLRGYED